MALKFVPDEHNFLDVTGKPLGLHLLPFLLLRVGSVLVEEHPSYTYEKKDIDPRNAETYLYRFLPAW